MFKKFLIIGIVCLCEQLVRAQNFQADCVAAHNKYRGMHSAPNLVSDSSMRQFAQDWANYLANTGSFQHRPNSPYGENLYALYGGNSASCSQAVKAWYDEIQDYNFNNPGFSMKTGHFTQVVWRNTARLGCASARKDSRVYIVCNYDPPGNYQGEFQANVLPN